MPITQLLESLLAALLGEIPGATEGRVRTQNRRVPYRRVDCDGRALAYIRPLRRRAEVRVDISGLWCVEREAPIRIATGTGAATLIVARPGDLAGAVAYVADAVQRTRAAHRRERMRRGGSQAA